MATLRIEHPCPQCGAPLDLEESDHLVSCGYCRVTSYLIQNPFFRYMLPHRAPVASQLIYVPYWRLKGVLFAATPNGVQHRFLDLSFQGIRSDTFPVSLGLRSQALKLNFALPQTPGNFLKATFPLEQAMRIFMPRFTQDFAPPIYAQALLGETLSLIYAPFYLTDRLYDALSNKKVSERLPNDAALEMFSQDDRAWRLLFVPTLCPRCGWNLSGARASLVLLCRNCQTIWFARGETLTNKKFVTLKMPGSIFLPFWRIKTAVEGINLKSRADLIRLANLARVAQPRDHDTDFFFWSPAFKIAPKVFLRLSQTINLAQPEPEQPAIEQPDQLPAGPVHPVTLHVSEAVAKLKISLALFATPSHHYLPYLSGITIQPLNATLVFIPFQEGHHELMQEKLGMVINKNQLRLSANL